MMPRKHPRIGVCEDTAKADWMSGAVFLSLIVSISCVLLLAGPSPCRGEGRAVRLTRHAPAPRSCSVDPGGRACPGAPSTVFLKQQRGGPPPKRLPTPLVASVLLRVENPSAERLTAAFSGRRLSGPAAGRAATSYGPIHVALAPGEAEIAAGHNLAPGVWVHRLAVPETDQAQARRSLVVADPSRVNSIAWQLFATVLVVNGGSDDGDGTCDSGGCTLRDAVETSARLPAPVLIRFDHAAFANGRALIAVTRNDGIVVRSAGTVIDGSDQSGHPSPLDDFSARTFPTLVTLRAPNADPDSSLLCPGVESPGGALRVAAERVGVVGLALERVLAPQSAVYCGDQDLLAFDHGSRGSLVQTSRLDGGARAMTSAEVESGTTGPATGKDCVDASNTGATEDAPILVENSELRFCMDRGAKSERGWLRLSRNWIHNNLRGGAFAMSPAEGDEAGVVEAVNNLIEQNGRNCPSGNPAACGGDQVVARGGASELSAQGSGAVVLSQGNIVRDGAMQGVYFENGSSGSVRDTYVCGIRASAGGKGILIQRSVGEAGDVVVRGSSAVYNDDAGVKLRGCVPADLGSPEDPGGNAFAENGEISRRNLVNALDAPAPPVSAVGNFWEHCYGESADADVCQEEAIGSLDANNGSGLGVLVDCGRPQPHQSSTAMRVDAVEPASAVSGGVVRLHGFGFDAISGHSGGMRGDCGALAAGNRCAPLSGTCVEFQVDGVWREALDVLAVTPTALTVRSPFTCAKPVLVRARRQILGGGEAVTPPVPFCTGDAL